MPSRLGVAFDVELPEPLYLKSRRVAVRIGRAEESNQRRSLTVWQLRRAWLRDRPYLEVQYPVGNGPWLLHLTAQERSNQPGDRLAQLLPNVGFA